MFIFTVRFHERFCLAAPSFLSLRAMAQGFPLSPLEPSSGERSLFLLSMTTLPWQVFPRSPLPPLLTTDWSHEKSPPFSDFAYSALSNSFLRVRSFFPFPLQRRADLFHGPGAGTPPPVLPSTGASLHDRSIPKIDFLSSSSPIPLLA